MESSSQIVPKAAPRTAPADQAAVLGARQALHNVPPQPTRLIGREDEIALVKELLLREDIRLLTLAGPGGVGKTRMAVAVAEEVVADFPGGCVFVDLSPLTDPAFVVRMIARAFGLRDHPALRPNEALAMHLRDRDALLVLDNLEHLLDTATDVENLLAASPGLTVLATSRAPLSLRREHLVQVPPLAVSNSGNATATLDELARTPAIALFVERAKAADAGFELTEANAAAVAELTRRLDGLPLALELAAARIRLLEPAALATRLEHSLSLLRWDASDLPPRQRSLRATLDWSHALLSPEEQIVFRRLGVFPGGFGVNAAIAVVALDAGEGETLDLLAELADKHLIRMLKDGSGDPWFVLPETVREYARIRLVASNEESDTRSRHLAYFVGLAERAEQELRAREDDLWSNWLPLEEANLLAALKWAIASGNTMDEWRLVASLWFFWWTQGVSREGAERVEAALSRPLPDAEPALLARLLEGAGVFADWSGDDERALTMLEHALALSRQANAPTITARVLGHLPRLAYSRGDPASARLLVDEMLALARSEGNQQRLGMAYAFRVMFAIGPHGSAGERERLRVELAEPMALLRNRGDRREIAVLLAGHARILAESDPKAAFVSLRAGLDLAKALDNPLILDIVFWLAAVMLAGRVPPDQAIRLVAAVSAMETRSAANGVRSTIDTYGTPVDRAALDRAAAIARQALGEAGSAAAAEAGAAFTIPEMFEEFLAAVDTVLSVQFPPAARDRDLLSPREREVLVLLVSEYSNKEIAEALFVSPNTVKTHVASLLNKLDADNRHQLAAIAIQRGLLDP